MLLLEGENIVTANVSGPIAQYVTSDVVLIIFYLPDQSFKSWGITGGNDLFELVAGEKYTVWVAADTDVPAFSNASNDSVAEIRTITARGETTDGATSDLPAIDVKNTSLNLVKITYSAINDDYTVKAGGELNFVIDVDSSGVVTEVDNEQLYIFNADLTLAIDTDTNKIIPQVTNGVIGFTGLTRWALKIEITTIIYPIPL